MVVNEHCGRPQNGLWSAGWIARRKVFANGQFGRVQDDWHLHAKWTSVSPIH
jgi:hypothetical protein